MHSVKKYLTLKVVRQVGGQDVIVLIDPRASHNLINTRFAKRNDLRIKDFEDVVPTQHPPNFSQNLGTYFFASNIFNSWTQ